MRRIVQYHQRLLELDPIALWLQDEKVGGTSYDWVRRNQGGDQDGAYTGVTLARPGIGDGRTSPEFDGINDFDNIWTPTFRDRFALTNHGAPGAVSEGTVLAWARVFNAGAWTDGAARRIVTLQVNADNRIFLQKHNNNNEIRWLYEAGNVIESIITGGHSDTDWMRLALTWSASAGANGEVLAYKNGVQEGATQVALGVWAGNLFNTTTVIGASITTPLALWHGYIDSVAVFDRALTPLEIMALYMRSF